ncbi:MAG: hypothetical protein IKU01_02380 [Bacteroidales bacterium]|nr:hypothetical protein [Bacteroidales bacterium]
MATLDDLMGGGASSSEENIITLGDITGQFKTKTQRQSYYEPEPEPTSDLDASLIDPEGETTASDYTGVWSPEGDMERTVSPERAHRTGERIARVIDTGFNFLASNIVAKGSGKEYKAEEKDLADIAEAWGDIAEEKQWEFSPGWQLVILYAIVYGPLAKEAFNDRRIMEIEQKQLEQEAKMRQMQNEIEQLNRIREYEAAEAARKAKAEAGNA